MLELVRSRIPKRSRRCEFWVREMVGGYRRMSDYTERYQFESTLKLKDTETIDSISKSSAEVVCGTLLLAFGRVLAFRIRQ